MATGHSTVTLLLVGAEKVAFSSPSVGCASRKWVPLTGVVALSTRSAAL